MSRLLNSISQNQFLRSKALISACSGVVLALGLSVTSVSLADESGATSKRDSKFFFYPPSSEEIGKHLFPEATKERRTRGISFASQEPEPTLQKSVSFPILFHFGKTTIVSKSQPFLDNIGEMMRSEPYANRTLIVEGHTDAVGSVEYNQRLSELRALAVKEYLVEQFSIDPLRLFTTGKGETLLYKPEKPHDGINRRVEFLPYNNG